MAIELDKKEIFKQAVEILEMQGFESSSVKTIPGTAWVAMKCLPS